ncbi:hypothetical protein [Nocardioides sp.]|uniref:hypothetical protein n=1 Tax=Nocardioides sp. TaxID=35761 RepID=UPI002B27875E|nr:hypothetical protein [Nocardioides sp.]
MNPLAAGLRQPDARSCGAASVVMAGLLREQREASPDEFRAEVLACHQRLTAAHGDDGWQVPWPRALGTPPWAIKRELEAITGRQHVVRLARWSRAAAYDRLLASGGALYVGSRLLPRHVLLALGPALGDRGVLSCYQPSRGTVVSLPRAEFERGHLGDAGWPHPWFTVSPSATAVRRARPTSRR